MSIATVTTRIVGRVLFQFTHQPGFTHYDIYSSESGPNVDRLMKLAKANQANPAAQGGLAKFNLTDEELGIKDFTKPWYLRICGKTGTGDVAESFVSMGATKVEPVSQLNPAMQRKLADDPSGSEQIDLVMQRWVPWRAKTATYKKIAGFAGSPTIEIARQVPGFSEVIIDSQTNYATAQYQKVLDLDLAAGEKLIVRTTGANPANLEGHEAGLSWADR